MSLLKRLYGLDWYKELIWGVKDKLNLKPSSLDEFAKRAQRHNATDVVLTVTTQHDMQESRHISGREHTLYLHTGQILIEAYKTKAGIETNPIRVPISRLKLRLEENNYTGQPHSDDSGFYQWSHYMQLALQEKLPKVKFGVRYQRRKK